MPTPKSSLLSVAVFAHNEEQGIEACLDSLKNQQPLSDRLRIYVLANGCTDRTEEIVLRYARQSPGIELISIALGDKSNAWNTYIHEVAVQSDIHFFIDGDLRACSDALVNLEAGLEAQRPANGAASFPRSGLSRKSWSEFIRKQQGMPGGLYALRGTFVMRLRQQNVVLPRGFVGDDVLLQFLVKTDLHPDTGTMDRSRIVLCEAAGFEFDCQSWWSPFDLIQQWRRMGRDALRECQTEMLMPRLKQQGISSMPRDIRELYRDYSPELNNLSLVKSVLRRVAHRKIRRDCADWRAASKTVR